MALTEPTLVIGNLGLSCDSASAHECTEIAVVQCWAKCQEPRKFVFWCMARVEEHYATRNFENCVNCSKLVAECWEVRPSV